MSAPMTLTHGLAGALRTLARHGEVLPRDPRLRARLRHLVACGMAGSEPDGTVWITNAGMQWVRENG